MVDLLIYCVNVLCVFERRLGNKFKYKKVVEVFIVVECCGGGGGIVIFYRY